MSFDALIEQAAERAAMRAVQMTQRESDNC